MVQNKWKHLEAPAPTVSPSPRGEGIDLRNGSNTTRQQAQGRGRCKDGGMQTKEVSRDACALDGGN